MQTGRIIRYGILYWIIGQVISYFQVSAGFSYLINSLIFYIGGGLLAILFFLIYFLRSEVRTKWKDGVTTALAWSILFVVLDSLIYLVLFKISAQTYFSLNFWLGLLQFIIIGAIVAELAGRGRNKNSPEGLV